MRARRRTVLLALAVLLVFAVACCGLLPAVSAAEDGGSSTSGGSDGGSSGASSSDGGNSGGSGSSGGGGGGGGGLLDAIASLIHALKQFVDMLGRVLRGEILDIFTEWLGRQFQKVLDMISGAFGVSFLTTPRLHSVPWVHRWWSWFFWLAFGLLFAATVWAGIRVYTASAQPGRDMWQPLKVVGAALLSAIVSLWAADFLVFLFNSVGSALLEDALKAGGVSPGSASSGRAVLGLMFAPDPSLAGRPLYEILIDKQNGGGFFLLVIVMTEVIILALLTLARHFLLCLLAVSAPAYFVGSALTARMEPLIGWWALTARTAGFQVVNDVVWVYIVRNRFAENGLVASGGGTAAAPAGTDFGVSAHFIAVVAMGLLIYLTWRYWFVPARVALSDPVTLAGGSVYLGLASLASGAARAAGLAGRVLKDPGLEEKGIKLGEAAGRLRDRAESLLEQTEAGRRYLEAVGNLPGGKVLGRVLDRLAPMPGRRDRVDSVRDEGPILTEGGVTWHAVRVPVGEAQAAADVLKRAGIPDAAVRVDPNAADIIKVARGYTSLAVQALKKAYRKRIPYWTEGNHYVVIQDGLPVRVPAPPDNGLNMGRWTG